MIESPIGWEWKNLADIAADEYGLVDGPFGSNLRSSEYTEVGVPVIRGSNLTLGTAYFVDDEFVFISESKADELARSNCFAEDIVFTKKGTLGQTGIIPNGHRFKRFVLSSNQMKITVNKAVADPYFVYYFVSSPASVDKIKRDAEATGVPKTNLAYLRTFPTLLPPLDEQRAIAEVLGSLDDKIEANRRQNETLEATARAIFKSWFVDFDPVHAKARGEHPLGMDAATAALFPDSFEESELGLIPRGWRWGTLRDCCEKVENGGTPKKSELAYWEPPDIAWLTSGKVRQSIITETDNFISQLGFNNSSAKLWEPGTTIVALYGATAGQVSLLSIQSTANQACCGLTPKDEMIFYVYLYTSNSVEALGMQARGSAQQNLSQGLVADFPALIPNNRILKTFQESVEPIFNKWISNLTEARTLAETRDALLPRLISGALRVGEIE